MTDLTEFTLGGIIAAIADDIDDTNGEYTDATRKAVHAAIRYCERETYYFNETRDVTFPTISGQAWYGAVDNPNIASLVHIVAAWKEGPSGLRLELGRETPEAMERISETIAARGEPWSFTYFNRQIRLYPIPIDSSFTIRLQLGPYRLAPLVNDEDANAWTTEAFDMIKARAKYILAKDTLKAAVTATEALNDYNDQHASLKAETSARNGRGVIAPTRF